MSSFSRDTLYLFPGPEIALRAGRGQGPDELHAPLTERGEDVIIPGKRDRKTVRVT